MKREMKDSGIEWIGDIPKEWDKTKLKFIIYDIQSGGTPSSANSLFYSDNGICWVTTSDMSSEDFVKDTKKKISNEGLLDKNLNIYPIGTLLYSIYASIGKVSELAVPATINQAILAIIVNKTMIYSTFLKFQLKSMEHYVIILSSLNTQNNLNAQKVINLPLCLPPLPEQQKIADYLDKKVSQIDHIIEKTKLSIDEYKKYKQSLITEVVTKGLDKDVEMKDSGIEWIGDIPKHWEVNKLKFISNVNPSNIDKKSKYEEDEIYLCNYIDVYKNDFITNNIDFMKATASKIQIEKFLLKKYDVIITKDSETPDDIGIPALVIEDFHNVLCGYHLTHIKPNKIDGRFLFRYLISKYIKSYFEVSSNGITRYGLGINKINNTFILIPPRPEQQKISDYLDKKSEEINNIISKKEMLIKELETYKKSLIYECVTGKREVN